MPFFRSQTLARGSLAWDGWAVVAGWPWVILTALALSGGYVCDSSVGVRPRSQDWSRGGRPGGPRTLLGMGGWPGKLVVGNGQEAQEMLSD